MTRTTDAPGFTAEDAARTLAHLEAYEETLTARAFGVTMIAFGIAGAATSMTYAYAAESVARAGYGWALSFFWIPWILAAALVSGLVWHTHAVTLRKPDESGPWWWFVLFSFAYIALLGGAWWLDARLGLGLGEANQNLLTLGVFTLGLGAFFQWRFGGGWMIRTLYIVALVLVALAFAYAALDLGPVAGQLLAAFTGLALWVGAGLYVALRG